MVLRHPLLAHPVGPAAVKTSAPRCPTHPRPRPLDCPRTSEAVIKYVESSNAAFLMEPTINTSFDGPQLDDLLALQRNYGDVLEESGGNNTSATASDLGSISVSHTVRRGTLGNTTVVSATATDFISIDDESDVDFFEFTVPDNTAVSLTLTPRGTTYQQGPQSGTQTSFNAAAQNDLTLQLRSTNGSTILQSANATGVGGTELISNFTLSAGGTYFVRVSGATTNTIQLYGLDVSITSTVVPEIQLLDGTTDIADGTGSVNFGSTPPGTPVTKTLTVKNLGTADLTLTQITQGSLPSGYTLVSGFGNLTLTPSGTANDTTTFQIRLEAGSVGSYSGPVSFANNDSDENPFNFSLSGQVAVPSTVQILDNGSPGYVVVSGPWSNYTSLGYDGEFDYTNSGTGNKIVEWRFTGLTPGTYQVATTWVQSTNRATNAPYTLWEGSTSLGTVLVNQQNVPLAESTAGGRNFQKLGAAVTITGSTLTVRLTNNANGTYVIADAVRIESLGAAESSALMTAKLAGTAEAQVSQLTDVSAVSLSAEANSQDVRRQLKNSVTFDTLISASVAAEATLIADGLPDICNASLDAVFAEMSREHELRADFTAPRGRVRRTTFLVSGEGQLAGERPIDLRLEFPQRSA